MTVREDVLQRLSDVRREPEASSVSGIWLFGSIARGEDREGSDVDVLVEFAAPVTLFEFVRLRRRLEALLGRSVDLVTHDALRPQFRDAILRDAVRAA
jgi:predicted nucleotidyltransferase